MKHVSVIRSAVLVLGAVALPAAAQAASMAVYKNPWCGCCTGWIEAVEKVGHTVAVTDMEDLAGIKKQAGIPAGMEACHTAVLDAGGDKYIVEGHVPLEVIDRLMAERRDIRGVAVPGMPSGSLGMGHDENAQYTVYSLTQDATTEVFHEVGPE